TVLDTRRPFELGLAGTLTLPVGSSDQYAADEAATGGARVLVGKSWGEGARSFVALNAGLVFRQTATLGNVQMGNQVVFGAGVHWALFGPVGVTGEVSGSTTWEDAFSSDQTPVGLILGLRYSGDGFAFAAGAGPGLTSGAGNPDIRALAVGGARFNRHAPEAAPRAEEKPAAVVAAAPVAAADPCQGDDPPRDPKSCPSLDADKDGLRNHDDACALDPEDRDDFQDGDGCPEADNDGDRIADADDQCPLDPESINGIDDEDGCPDKVRVVNGQIATLEPVYFESGSSKIAERSQPMLSEMAHVIATRSELGVISIEGHTDSRGSDKANQKLSQSRAESVRAFLIEGGVDAGRLTATGYGEARPLVAGASADAHAKNRRVEFRFEAPSAQLSAQK
ncbi:MAG TPA: OmpA family protein, partial [Polyangiaceae bacterium]|nr:OmpA family protein [Polyangiaceae bacterium]